MNDKRPPTLYHELEQFKVALRGCVYDFVAPVLIPILNTLTRWLRKI